jgi:carbonic anhydrase
MMNKYQKPAITLILFIVVTVISLPTASGEMRSTNKQLAGTPPFEVLKKIIAANQTAVETYVDPRKGFAPLITWLTDPDVRIQPYVVMKSPADTLFTCRNMGAQLEVSAGQVEYGIRHLHTPILLITLDSDNQFIRLFMEGYADMAPAIRQELDHLHLPMEEDKSKESFQERLIQNVEANIDYQVDRAVSLYKDRIDMGRLAVIGTIADFANVYKRGAGRLIIINVNGEKDDGRLRDLPMMVSISPQMRKVSIGRERPKPVPQN